MARLARVEVFSSDEVAIVHVMNRTVRRCFLMGNDELTGKNYDHRKGWLEAELRRLASGFGIDLLCYAVMSNHFHLVLRSRPDVVDQWDDTEVARRWLILCPVRKGANRQPEEPTESELNMIRNNKSRLAAIRSRLSDISWWMRLLSQNVAQRANREDKEVGKFWQARYRAVRLLDETAVLACAAYVDLNPIRAAMAETLETSNYTSAQKRCETIKQCTAFRSTMGSERQGSKSSKSRSGEMKSGEAKSDEAKSGDAKKEKMVRPDEHMAPVEINERRDAIGPRCNRDGHRASDKGFLPMPTEAYLQLLDWTARQICSGKRGRTPEHAKPILERLGISGEVWVELVKEFGRLFMVVAGKPHEIEARRSRNGKHRYKSTPKARELLAATK